MGQEIKSIFIQVKFADNYEIDTMYPNVMLRPKPFIQ